MKMSLCGFEIFPPIDLMFLSRPLIEICFAFLAYDKFTAVEAAERIAREKREAEEAARNEEAKAKAAAAAEAEAKAAAVR